MIEKGGSFLGLFEKHVEKLVLVIVGIVCLWLLITRVVISPSCVEYDNQKLRPGEIDDYIVTQTEDLQNKLNRSPEPMEPYVPKAGGFIAKIDSAIDNINVDLTLPIPPHVTTVKAGKGKYRIPVIGEVNDVDVEHIRTVAYVPTEIVNEETPYQRAENEPNDIDFVTVQAKLDVAGLYQRFYESFAGGNVKQEWQDPCLATPVFASVQTQRQELLADGTWSDWHIVPRTQIDHRKRMFSVAEDVRSLPPGGIKVPLIQFADNTVLKDLLQPEAYKVASAKEDWFPPSLHRDFVKYQREIDTQEKREAQRVKKEEREREEESSDRRKRTPRPRGTTAGGMPPGMGGMGMPMGMGGGSPMGGGGGGGGGGMMPMPVVKKSTRRSRISREVEKERSEKVKKEPSKTINDVIKEFEEVLIKKDIEFDKLDEPLMFWTHDDTVEPGKSYRYRVRLGVFNPIAGTNQFYEQDKAFNNQVILWSNFSDVTKPVEIPEKLYFFPRDIQEVQNAVKVMVSRYALGYWYSQEFTVKKGDVIGNIVEYDKTKEEEEENVTVPENIDYSTGAVLVDIIPVNDWSGSSNLRARYYHDMIYTLDGTAMEHVPIKTKYWADGLLARFSEIKRLEKETKLAFRPFGTRPGMRQPGTMPPGMQGMPPGMMGMPPGMMGMPPGMGMPPFGY